ncbi:recombination protein F [compost metagenome]
MRSIVLALKFLEVDIIEKITSIKPVVLLDDVFSELDEQRQSALMTNMNDCQLILTTTDNHHGENEIVSSISLT